MKVRMNRWAVGGVALALLIALAAGGACQAPGWLRPPFHEPSITAP